MSSSKMLAVVGDGKGSFSLKRVSIPQPGPNEVLVKVEAAAQNPTDCGLRGVSGSGIAG